MDLSGRIRRAALEAVEAVGLQDAAYDSHYIDPEFTWAHVHYRTLAGARFSVRILLGGHPEQPANTTVGVLKEQIVPALQSNQTF